MALAAPPLGWFPLAWVGLVPLWQLVWPRGDDRRSPGSLGSVAPSLGTTLGGLGIWGITYHGLLLHWITGLHPLMWMGIPWAGSVAIAGGAWVGVTLWVTAPVVAWGLTLRLLLGFILPRLPQGWGEVTGLMGGLGLWNTYQTLLQGTPLTWASLSLSQSPSNLPLVQWARISGPLTIDSALLGVAGLIALGLIALESGLKGGDDRASGEPLPSDRPPGDRPPRHRPSAQLYGLGAIVLVLGLQGGGWGLLHWGSPADNLSQRIPLGIIQGNIPTREKLTPAGLETSEQAYRQGYRTLQEAGAAAVLLPEGAIPTLWEGARRFYSPLYQTLRQGTIPAWVATFLHRDEGYSQSLILMQPGGTVTARYDKTQLVPFGEYVPGGEILGRVLGRLSPIESQLVPGTPGQTFPTPWGSAAVAICYEPFFPRRIQSPVQAGAEFILTASNLDPYDRRLMAQHEAQDVLLAVALDRWLVRATNTGYSGFISPQGQVHQRSQPRQYATLLAPIYPRTTLTPYARWGDWLTPILDLGALGLGILGWGKTRNIHP